TRTAQTQQEARMVPGLSLEGRVAIVTGAGRGIGRAMSLSLAEAGADVVATARTATEIDETTALVEKTGRRALAITADVSSSAEVDEMVGRTLDEFGQVDILVNNAGKLFKAPLAPFPDVTLDRPRVTRRSDVRHSDEEWQSVLDINLSGVFYCCRAVAPHMMERKYGKIINIGSNNATQAFPLVAAYNASKAGVNMITRVMALEWADYNICVNAIGPGDYHTEMTDRTWSDADGRQRHLDGIPMHREGDLRELGVLAAYLASPASDYMTGQLVYMDGGLTAR
ncbi:MAG: SDR family oxidoreductase, partial [SAR202 cluster bacterium]|nr:SDR family oxidoreductase [SAR202 cluster bacterium]